ncbi:MAG: prolyl oligopeptidase family serine peptidase [Myxococcota bacterium]
MSWIAWTTFAAAAPPTPESDPFLWLEEVSGERALEWVEAHNDKTVTALTKSPQFAELQERLASILDSDDRIPYLSKIGDRYLNFWRDAEHPRGLWRQTTLASYQSDAPVWETILDIDALAKAEEENWVFSGASCVRPEQDRCLVRLSRGGSDATVIREFDLPSRSFVEGGFELPEAKSRVEWIDRDTLFVGTDFGEASLTDSGYPRMVRKWRRGTSIDEAEPIFEGSTTDVAVSSYHDASPGYERNFVSRQTTFFTSELFEITKKGLVRIDKPDSASVYTFGRWAFVELRDAWEVSGATYPAGSLLVTDYKRLRKGKPRFEVLFEPTDTTSLRDWVITSDRVVLQLIDNVQSRLVSVAPEGRNWMATPLANIPENASIYASEVDRFASDAIWLYGSGFITPSRYAMMDFATGETTELGQLPAFFDAEGLEVAQHFVASDDGTKIPYFLVTRAGQDDPVPTLMTGYGGFEIPLLPGYRAATGAGWLERGGAYVVANIRGGGEYGPRWHDAALRDKRHKAYEDFAAIGRDLVSRGITTADQLAIQGGSNGGLLMGNMYTTYPELWGAVICQVPLLDMKRYTKLLAGASWADEYGDPDNPDDWAFLQRYSPYHNLDPEETEAPPLLVTTSTRDDRVHPGHARKFVAALEDMGREDVWYYENVEGGHGGAANNAQRAFMTALAYTFAWNTLTGAAERTEEPEARR